MKNSEVEDGRSLREIENAVVAEGQEWIRHRLEEELQQQADRQGRVFPPQRPTAPPGQSATDAPTHQRRRRRTAGLAGD